MPIVPDLNEYVQPSPHSSEGLNELHQKVIQPVRGLTGDRLQSQELKPPILDDPIPAEFQNIHQESVVTHEHPAEIPNLEGTRARVTQDNQGVINVLLERLGRRGQVIVEEK